MVASAATSIPGVNVAEPAGSGEAARPWPTQAKTYDSAAPLDDGLTGTPTIVLVRPSGGKLTVVDPGREPRLTR